MIRCRSCNRILKNQESIKLGIGPFCLRKVGGHISSKKDAADSDTLEPYDGGNFWIERVEAKTLRGDGLMHFEKHSASGVKSNVTRQIYKHSPTGYNFGYGGSGPSDFALNVCLLLVHPDDAYRLYQDFKWQFVAKDAGDRLVIPRAQAEEFFTTLGVPLLSKG